VDSDEERVEFATYFLEDLRFLYREADDGKKWRGRFGGSFVLQAFAIHLSAISGSARVPDLHDKPSSNAVGALGLAAASVERALRLIATGTLTIAVANASKGKVVTLPRSFNRTTGKEPMRQTGFNDTTWGKVTRSYTLAARELSNSKFESIVEEAQPFVNVKSNRFRKTEEAVEVIDSDDSAKQRQYLYHTSGEDNSDCMSGEET